MPCHVIMSQFSFLTIDYTIKIPFITSSFSPLICNPISFLESQPIFHLELWKSRLIIHRNLWDSPPYIQLDLRESPPCIHLNCGSPHHVFIWFVGVPTMYLFWFVGISTMYSFSIMGIPASGLFPPQYLSIFGKRLWGGQLNFHQVSPLNNSQWHHIIITSIQVQHLHLHKSLLCTRTNQASLVRLSIQISYILINKIYLKPSFKYTLHKFSWFKHKNIKYNYKSNINYTLTQAPSFFKILGLPLAPLFGLWS